MSMVDVEAGKTVAHNYHIENRFIGTGAIFLIEELAFAVARDQTEAASLQGIVHAVEHVLNELFISFDKQ